VKKRKWERKRRRGKEKKKKKSAAEKTNQREKERGKRRGKKKEETIDCSYGLFNEVLSMAGKFYTCLLQNNRFINCVNILLNY
jgi:hypothetical protein